MALIFFTIEFLFACFDKVCQYFEHRKCKTEGHQGWRTIEKYGERTLIKNYVVYDGKNVKVPPYQITRIRGKHECGRCGALFVGVIVKDAQLPDTTHETC